MRQLQNIQTKRTSAVYSLDTNWSRLASAPSAQVRKHTIFDQSSLTGLSSSLCLVCQAASAFAIATQLPSDNRDLMRTLCPNKALLPSMASILGAVVGGSCLHSGRGGADNVLAAHSYQGKTESIDKPVMQLGKLAFRARFVVADAVARTPPGGVPPATVLGVAVQPRPLSAQALQSPPLQNLQDHLAKQAHPMRWQGPHPPNATVIASEDTQEALTEALLKNTARGDTLVVTVFEPEATKEKLSIRFGSAKRHTKAELAYATKLRIYKHPLATELGANLRMRALFTTAPHSLLTTLITAPKDRGQWRHGTPFREGFLAFPPHGNVGKLAEAVDADRARAAFMAAAAGFAVDAGGVDVHPSAEVQLQSAIRGVGNVAIFETPTWDGRARARAAEHFEALLVFDTLAFMATNHAEELLALHDCLEAPGTQAVDVAGVLRYDPGRLVGMSNTAGHLRKLQLPVSRPNQGDAPLRSDAQVYAMALMAVYLTSAEFNAFELSQPQILQHPGSEAALDNLYTALELTKQAVLANGM